MQAAISLRAGPCGADVQIISAVIPPEACYLGWQEALTRLAQLVEADIPGCPGTHGQTLLPRSPDAVPRMS